MDEHKDRAQAFSDRVNSFPGFVVVVVIAVAIVVALNRGGGGSDEAPAKAGSMTTAPAATAPSTATPASTGVSREDPEWKLAAIANGGDIALDDPSVDVFATRLDRLEARCLEDRSYLADMTVRAAELTSEASGAPAWLANTMNGVIGYIEGLSTPEHECQEDFARYVSDHA
jgi:hypothetical protein